MDTIRPRLSTLPWWERGGSVGIAKARHQRIEPGSARQREKVSIACRRGERAALCQCFVRNRRRIVAILLGFVAGACGANAGAPALDERLLTSGRSVAQLVSDRTTDTVFVVVYDPAQCFSCYQSLSRWTSLRKAQPQQVAILLSRPPSPAERDQLLAARVDIDGVLSGGATVTPTEALFADGACVVLFENSDTRLLKVLDAPKLPDSRSRLSSVATPQGRSKKCNT